MPMPVKPSPSLAVSVAALLVALGGTSYAAVQIGSQEIKNDSIQSKDVKNKTLRSGDLAKGGVKSSDVKDGSLQTKDFEAGQVPQGPAGVGRWVLVNAAGQIEAQSGGFTVTAGYPAAPAAANGNVYINANEPLTNNAVVATIALQNTVDQNGDAIQNGTVATPDANPEFSGEIAVSQCAPTGTSVTNCAPAGTNNVNHFVVSPRNSDGTPTVNGARKRFYVVISGDSKDYVAP